MTRRYYTYACVSSADICPDSACPHDVHEDDQHSEKVIVRKRDFPGTFFRLHESRDRKLCVFEDAQGHVTAVRAARLV